MMCVKLSIAFSLILAAGSIYAADTLDPHIAKFFTPPPEYAKDFGNYRSPLKFDDGTEVKTATDWQKRREEIRKNWHDMMGAWPPLIEKPKIDFLAQEKRDN